MDKLPRWDMSTVYPQVSSSELAADFAALEAAMDEIEKHLASDLAAASPATPPEKLALLLDRSVDLFNGARLISSTLETYLDCTVATDSYDTAAAKKQSEVEIAQVRLRQQWIRFQGWLRGLCDALPRALEHAGAARQHAFILREAADQAAFLMGEQEEMVAAELSLPGANGWSKLQRTLTSQGTVAFELDGATHKLPLPALINLRSHPEESVRRRAYEAEMREWERLREPLASCMNGVKGTAVILNRRRGRTDCLHAPIDQARIDRATLEALLAAMRDSRPVFNRYLRAKAARMGKEKLAWWDLSAPSGKAESSIGWDQARWTILSTFASFSAELHAFARRAFDKRWIDADPRDGKRGGAFCTSAPLVKESRVLCNFDGSLDQLATVAHELGHAFHNECAYRAGKTELQQVTPMTLAETASIMCETIVNDAVRAKARDAREELAILENALISDMQVIVDIYSRFLFEKEVMERRQSAELAADELCAAMDRAQEEAYGDALDPRYRHPYMWTWKPHYYDANLNFYNFPYAFGLLFGTGLYAIYRQKGQAFVADYQKLLESTGEANAADLASRFGIDIRSRAFWDRSIGVIASRVDRYCEL